MVYKNSRDVMTLVRLNGIIEMKWFDIKMNVICNYVYAKLNRCDEIKDVKFSPK